MNNRKLWILFAILFFIGVSVGSFFFFRKFTLIEKQTANMSIQSLSLESEDYHTLRMYYPVNNRIQMIEKRLPKRTRQISIAEAVIEEFFKGPGNGNLTYIPQNVKLLGLYKDPDQILYIDLSDEFRRNFQGDAISEYLILKGIYDSLVSNLQDFQDFKILLEGKETETFGGHFYLKYTLRNFLSNELKGENIISDE